MYVYIFFNNNKKDLRSDFSHMKGNKILRIPCISITIIADNM